MPKYQSVQNSKKAKTIRKRLLQQNILKRKRIQEEQRHAHATTRAESSLAHTVPTITDICMASCSVHSKSSSTLGSELSNTLQTPTMPSQSNQEHQFHQWWCIHVTWSIANTKLFTSKFMAHASNTSTTLHWKRKTWHSLARKMCLCSFSYKISCSSFYESWKTMQSCWCSSNSWS